MTTRVTNKATLKWHAIQKAGVSMITCRVIFGSGYRGCLDLRHRASIERAVSHSYIHTRSGEKLISPGTVHVYPGPSRDRAVEQTADVILIVAGWINDMIEDDLRSLALEFSTGDESRRHSLLCSRVKGNCSVLISCNRSNRTWIYRSLTSTSTLYYEVRNDILQWSVDPLDLFRPSIDRVDVDILPLLLTGQERDRSSCCYKGLNRLPAGHMLTAAGCGHTAVRQIADFVPYQLPRKTSIDEMAAHVRDLVVSSAKRCILPKEKVGVLTSGGLDSAIVIYSLLEAGASVTAFHWSAVGCRAADEHDYAHALCSAMDVPVVDIDVGPDIAKDSMYLDPKWAFSIPYNHSFYKWFVKTAAVAYEMGITALASGHLADSAFGGTPELSFVQAMTHLPWREAFTYFVEAAGTTKRLWGSNQTASFTKSAFYYLTSRSREGLTSCESAKMVLSSTRPCISDFYEPIKMGLENERESELTLSIMTPVGGRFIHPFADESILNFALGLPLPYRLFPYGSQLYEKPLLRKAFVGLLPKEIVTRNHRSYWSAVAEEYCLNNQGLLLSFLGDGSLLSQLDVIDPKIVADVISDYRRCAESAMSLILAAMVELWLRSLT